MSTKDVAGKVLNSAYRGVEGKLRTEQAKRNGGYSVGGIVTPKPGGVSHLEQIAREYQAQQAENEAAIADAQARRQAVEALDQLKSQKQQEWLQAGGTLAEFKASWPELRRHHLMSKVSGA